MGDGDDDLVAVPMANSSNAWDGASKWITQHQGGYVNPLLCYDASRRQVSVKDTAVATHPDDGSGCINEGDVLLQIPDACLLSLHTIENTTFGKTLFSAVHSLLPKNVNDKPATVKRARVSQCDVYNAEEGLFNDEQDVIIALFLAYLMEKSGQQEQESADQSCNVEESKPWHFFRPYLNTLPTNLSGAKQSSQESKINEYLGLLPRQWPLETIEYRLAGTSLYQRVLSEKKGLIEDYNAVKSAWENDNHSHNEPDKSNSDMFPCLESFDMMIATVTSRGFAGLGYEGVDVMIPLLDLLNHTRGGYENGGEAASESRLARHACQNERVRGIESDSHGALIKEATNSTVADVRYERYEVASMDSNTQKDANLTNKTLKRKEPTSTTTRTTGGIQVTAARKLLPGAELLMTYGAKGNASLLGRYGFCIENNVEPDGSCNDILEIQLRPDTKPVHLQRGPKSYSYSPFVEALSLFHHHDTAIHKLGHSCLGGDDDNDANEDDNLDAFLDGMDSESVDVDDEPDYYNPSNEKAFLESHSTGKAQINADISAVESLIAALVCAKSKLTAKEHVIGKTTNIQEYYCSILIESEIQTLEFFLAVSKTLKDKLDKLLENASTGGLDSGDVSKLDGCILDKNQGNETQRHIFDVVDAFLSIRYSM